MKSRRSWSDKVHFLPYSVRLSLCETGQVVLAQELVSDSQATGLLIRFQAKIREAMQIEVITIRVRWYNHLVPGISKKVWSKA